MNPDKIFIINPSEKTYPDKYYPMPIIRENDINQSYLSTNNLIIAKLIEILQQDTS